MSFDVKEYAQKEIPTTSRKPLTIQELLEHPERRAELYLDGKTHQDALEESERAEDAYYDALGEEIERHPICSPELTIERRRRAKELEQK